MINIEILQEYFETMGLESVYTVCINGQIAIDSCISLINDKLSDFDLLT